MPLIHFVQQQRLSIHILASLEVKQAENYQNRLASYETQVNWNSIIKNQEDNCFNFYPQKELKKKVNPQVFKMNSDEQTTLMKNLQIGDASDSMNEFETGVLKCQVTEERVKQKSETQSSVNKESQIEIDYPKTKEVEEKDNRKVSMCTVDKENDLITSQKCIPDKEMQTVEAEKGIEKHDSNNPQPFHIDFNASALTETDCTIGKNLENVDIEQNLEIAGIYYDDTNQIQHDKDQIHHDKDQIQHDKDQIQHDKDQVQHDKDQIQHDKDPIQLDKDQIQHDKDQVQHDKDQVQHDKDQVQHDKDQVQHDKDQVQHDKDQVQHDKDQVQHDKDQIQHDKDQIQHTPGVLKPLKCGSELVKDTDEDRGSLQHDHDENMQMTATADETEYSLQMSTGSKNKKKDKKKKRKDNKKKDKASTLKKRFNDRDTENYRNGYPDKEDDKKLKDNIRFYMGEIPSIPDGALIDDIHKNWFGDHKRLEIHHGYIQWLFPIRENGMNWQAQPLQLHEAQAIKTDPKAMKRVLESYKLILDFYGMKLVDEKTGKLERSQNWDMCFKNLNWSSHNYLRITRILKCLGELGYEHLKKGFLQFVLKEALEHGTLDRTLTSCRDYWIGTIKDDSDREELYNYIDHHVEGNYRVGLHGLIWQNYSGFAQTMWACRTFFWRLLLRLAYYPVSVVGWFFTLIYSKCDRKKSV